MLLARRNLLRSAGRLGAGVAIASAVPTSLASLLPSAQTSPLSASPAPAPPAEITGAASLGAHAAERGLLYGCAVDPRGLAADPSYAALVRRQCRILVPENAMKWGALRPSAETFRFDDADAVVAFAETNHMKVRGHNLVWHRDNPKWFDSTVTPANARQTLISHIQTVAGRYAGRIHSWDVVNEAVELPDGRPDGLRNSPWLRLLGDDYIDLAFRTARSADPHALLTYNDYGIEDQSPAGERKRQAILAMLRRMITRRVPIDALGVQSHITAQGLAARGSAPDYGAGLVRFIAQARELGLQVFITEMDVNDRKLPPEIPSRDAAVAAAYKQYLNLVLADSAVRAMLTWGITNRYTWLNGEGSRQDGQPERALPFTADCTPAPAFFAIRESFDARRLADSPPARR